MLIAGGIFAGTNCPLEAKAQTCGAAKMAEVKTITVKEGEEIVVLNVSKMTCGGCASHVTKTLTAVEGVSDVAVNLQDGTATVSYSPAKVKPEMLTAVVVKAGYPTTIAEAKETAPAKAGCDPKDCKKAGCDPTACGLKTASKAGNDGK